MDDGVFAHQKTAYAILMTKPDTEKLTALHRRMVEAQRALILEANAAEHLPPSSVLGRIADLDGAIMAVESMLEEASGNDQ
jgi:hypothetical protein